MRKKYLVKSLIIECTACLGNGRYYPDTGGFNCNCDLSKPCKMCKGTFITITSKHPLFKEEYGKFIKKEVERLTREYRQAKEVAGSLGDELGKYCKEYDKIINRGK